MKKEVIKPEKVALCRACHGTGKITEGKTEKICQQCDGSGRVLVSCQMTVNIRPFKESK